MTNGTFICTNDTKNEIQFYHDIKTSIQSRIDMYLQQRPGDIDGAQTYLNNMLKNDIFGIYLNNSKECLQSLGYDTSTLNPFTVPEFSSLSGMIIAISISGVIIIAAKFRFRL